jgi:uncharacterized protein YggL (DUF469 family)
LKPLTPDELKKPRCRRLRKKLRVGEFQEFGLSLNISFDAAVIAFDDALDRWIDFVESKHWAFGGGGNGDNQAFSGFICRYERGSLTEQDRGAIQAWLSQQDWVTDFAVHELHDVWHGYD